MTVDLATIDAYKARLAAWKAGFADLAAKRRASYVDLLVGRQPRRPDVRRAAPPSGAGLTRCRSSAPLALPACCSSRPSSRCTCSSCGATRRSSRRRCCGAACSTDVEANAPWQRLRRSLLLLLQLLLVSLLVLLAARPFLERPAGLARDVVLVMDTSASMAATDVAPNRLAAARDGRHRRARATCRPAARSASSPPTGARGSSSTRRPTSAASARRSTTCSPTATPRRPRRCARARRASWPRAPATPRSSSRPTRRWPPPPTAKVDAPIKVLPVGRDRKNQAIVALAVRTAPSAVTRSVFVSVANLDIECAQRRIEVWGDDRLLEARDVSLDAQARSDVVIDDVPHDVGVVEVRLVGPDPASTAAPDPARGRRPRLGRPARRAARSSSCSSARATRISRPRSRTCPNVELYGVTPEEYGPATAAQGRPPVGPRRSSSRRCRRRCRTTPILAIAPPRSSPLGEVDRHAQGPGIGVAEPGRADPALRRPVHDPHLAGAAADARRTGHGRSSPARRARPCSTPASGPACRPRSWPSSRATPTCRSRSRSRSCSPT